MNVDILRMRLTANGYDVITAGDGEQALSTARERQPDLILLDIMMPKVDGLSVCRELKADESLPFMPIIMVTAKAESGDVVAGLDAGADEYLTKPVDQAALVARVKSMLRIKELHDTVQAQSEQLAEWNRTLEKKVEDQLTDLERLGRLKRFFSPQLSEAIVSQGGEELLKSHRSEISVVFCDLRAFTAFSETAEPEEVSRVLQEYFSAMGELIFENEGTIERFVGDSIMVLFNDPLPCPRSRASRGPYGPGHAGAGERPHWCMAEAGTHPGPRHRRRPRLRHCGTDRFRRPHRIQRYGNRCQPGGAPVCHCGTGTDSNQSAGVRCGRGPNRGRIAGRDGAEGLPPVGHGVQRNGIEELMPRSL